MVEPVTFEARAQKSEPRFSVPSVVLSALGLPYEADDSVFLRICDAASGEELWSGEKQLRSGSEIYGRNGPGDVGFAIGPGQLRRPST